MSSNRLFVGASEYYTRYRILYPNIVTDLMVKKSNFEVCGVILDLGCGTGQLSISFALSGYTVHAVDIDSSMLFQGIALAEQHECRSIRWQIGSDKTLRELKLPALDLCVMGASFHWMDRSVLIKILDELIIPQGRIVVVSGSPASVW